MVDAEGDWRLTGLSVVVASEGDATGMLGVNTAGWETLLVVVPAVNVGAETFAFAGGLDGVLV